MTIIRRDIARSAAMLAQPFGTTIDFVRDGEPAARLLPNSRTIAACVCAAAELLLASAAAGCALVLPSRLSLIEPSAFVAGAACLLAGAVAVAASASRRAYDVGRLADPARGGSGAWAAGLGAGAGSLMALAGPEGMAALLAATVCALSVATVAAGFRRLAGRAIRAGFARRRLLYKVAVLGESAEAAELRAALRARDASGLALEEHPGAAAVLARWGSFDRFCLHARIDALVVDPEDFRQGLGGLRGAPAEVLSAGPPRWGELALAGHPLEGLKLTRLQRPAMSQAGLLAKTAFDLTAAVLLLIGILPTLVAVAVAIKLDTRGPVLFRQPRIGYANQPFNVFKFRTMYHDMTDMMAARQTERGDPRVTRVGRLLRRLSIDELPQLLNVLRGDMSLVGPRPHAPHTNIDGYLLQGVVSDYARRHRVKPGITGWAQINGSRGALRTPEQLKRRVRLDLIYIARWSLWLDVRILVLTVFREIFSKNAF